MGDSSALCRSSRQPCASPRAKARPRFRDRPQGLAKPRRPNAVAPLNPPRHARVKLTSEAGAP